MAGRLSNRAAVITGASDGIGRGMARRFATEGAAVLVADVNEAKGQAVVEELKALGARSAFFRCDVTDKTAVEAMIATTAELFGSVDILVNNAYRGRGLARVETMDDVWFEESFRINFWAAKWSMMAALPHMRTKGWGRIINVCSLNGVNAHMGTADYNVGKEALRTLTRSAAREWAGLGICANVICPGFVRTPLVDKQIPEQAQELGISEERVIKEVMLGETVDKQFTMVEDIAEIALLLAAFKSNALTGESIIVSHGWHMN